LDVGAGSGSIAIEWLLSHPACRALAIERDATAARASGATRWRSVCRLEVIEAQAPPVSISSRARRDLHRCGRAILRYRALLAGALFRWRLVINAVALETEQLLLRGMRSSRRVM